MIQRIQSVFLLLAAASYSLVFAPVMSFFSIDGTVDDLKADSEAMLNDGIFNISDHIILLICAGLVIGIAIIAIFLYSNRTIQLKLGRLGIVLTIISMVLIAILFFQDYNKLTSRDYLINVEYGIIAPLISMVMFILASRAIKKDEALVKSMDRLR